MKSREPFDNGPIVKQLQAIRARPVQEGSANAVYKKHAQQTVIRLFEQILDCIERDDPKGGARELEKLFSDLHSVTSGLSNEVKEEVLGRAPDSMISGFPEALMWMQSNEQSKALKILAGDRWADAIGIVEKPWADVNETDFHISFYPDLTEEQVEASLKALADYYRACGGLGIEVEYDGLEVSVGDHALA